MNFQKRFLFRHKIKFYFKTIQLRMLKSHYIMGNGGRMTESYIILVKKDVLGLSDPGLQCTLSKPNMETQSKTRDAKEIQQQLIAPKVTEIIEIYDQSSESEQDDETLNIKNEIIENIDGDAEYMLEDDNLEIEHADITKPSTSHQLSKTLCGKNIYNWTITYAPEIGNKHCMFHLPSGKGQAALIKNPLEAWSLLIPDALLNTIVTHTNEEIAKKRKKYKDKCNTTNDVGLEEFKAFLALLYFSGLHKNNHNNVDKLWSGFASPIYRATMSRNRFVVLLTCIRFDDKDTRHERQKIDKLAPIREIWDSFISNCKTNYTPHEYCTINEQLIPFCGRCPFRIHMRNRPDKYGIKIMMMNDVETYYMINAIPYTGNVETDPSESIPLYYLRKLSEPIHKTNRNITCGNWCISIPSVCRMKQDFQLTVVGTIRKDENGIPEIFKQCTNVERSARYAYGNDMVLISYCPKKNKNVLFVSSLHKYCKPNLINDKPEVITFYNSTKSGTDIFVQLCQEYTTTRATRRWPLKLFFAILDQSAINSFILYQLNAGNQACTRAEYLEQLCKALVSPFLLKRLQTRTLRISLKFLIKHILGLNDIPEEQNDSSVYKIDKRARCVLCPMGKDRKTQFLCPSCKVPRCDEHRSTMCVSCASSKL